MTTVALGDIAELIMGQAPPGDSCNQDGRGTPFVKAGEFGEQRPIIREWTTHPVQFAKATDVLVCVVGATAGKLNLGADCAIGRSVGAVRPRSGRLDQMFAYQFLRTQTLKLRGGSQGSAQGVITRGMLEKLPVPNVSLAEQRQIADILDKAEANRSKRKKTIALAEELLRSTFLETFGNPVTNSKGWPVRSLGELGELDRGRSRHRPRNDPRLLGGKHPLIQTGEVANCNGGVITSFEQTYSDLGLAQSKMWPAGTLCITIAANIAKTGVLGFDACFPDSVVGFTPGEDATTEYVQYWLGFLQPALERQAPQSAQKNINLEILRTLAVPKPPIEHQQRFSELVSKIRSVRHTMREALDRSEHLFQSLLARAFSGSPDTFLNRTSNNRLTATHSLTARPSHDHRS